MLELYICSRDKMQMTSHVKQNVAEKGLKPKLFETGIF